MRRIKKKMLLMCTVALICAGVFTFNSCATTTGVSTGLLLTWLAVDTATLLSVWWGEEKVSAENAKDQTNGFINGKRLIEFTVPTFGRRDSETTFCAEDERVACGIHMHCPRNAEIQNDAAFQTDECCRKIVYTEFFSIFGM